MASMDTNKEDTDAKTAPEARAMPAPGEPGPGPDAVPSVPLHGPVDAADNSLEGLRTAFKGLSVEEAETDHVKGKREREKGAGDSTADEGVEHGRDPTLDAPSTTREPPFESAPSTSGLHPSPSPTTTTLPTPDPAATSSTPITTPPTAVTAEGTGFTGIPACAYPAYGVDPSTAEGTGFTGMPAPAYPAYNVDPPVTARPKATTASEQMASGSAPLWYAAEPDHHHHHEFPGYTTLSGLRRGPSSRGSKSRGPRGSSDRSVTRSKLRKDLRGATTNLVGDITQEIRAKLEPLIPLQGSSTTLGASPHRLQANHLVAGLSHTLGGVRSRPMPTPAAVPRSPFVPGTAQSPYSQVTSSLRAELDRLGLTALRAMVDVEPYGSSDLGGDPSDDEPPSLSSTSPSDDHDPEDPDYSKGKIKKKRKSRRLHSKDAKAVATLKAVGNLRKFTGKDLSSFAENCGRFLRMTGQTHASGRVKCNLLLQCCKTKYPEKQVEQIVSKSATFAEVLVALERQYPSYRTDLSIRTEIQNLAMLPNNPKAARITDLLADLDH